MSPIVPRDEDGQQNQRRRGSGCASCDGIGHQILVRIERGNV
jgi:hypothetical protein